MPNLIFIMLIYNSKDFADDINTEFKKKGLPSIFPEGQNLGAKEGLICPYGSGRGSGRGNGSDSNININSYNNILETWQRKMIIEVKDLFETNRMSKEKCIEYINREVKHEAHRNQILGELGWI